MKSAMLEHGLDGLNDHQVLEILLFYAKPQGDTNPIAHRLIQHFGTLKGVLEADYEDLLRVDGIGENAASLIKFSQMFSGRYLCASCFDGEVLHFGDTVALRRYYEGVFLGVKDEQIRAMLFDDELNMIKEQMLMEGTINKVELSTRKFADFVIKNNCSRVVIAHNHPNGSCLPSSEDVEVTKYLADFLKVLEIELLDHIVVGRTGSFSMFTSKHFN
ncbi:MAG: RadC family protein [Ruminiclostridium sp.]|nr:RadC family protein [Ruminiclostridium sp.]